MPKKRQKEPVVPFEQGNIDVSRRPIVQTAQGSATLYSISFSDNNGKEILIPRVAETDSGNARIMSSNEAIINYYKTGKHLGKFNTVSDANKYAKWLHTEEQKRLNKRNLKDVRR
jgi:hypothetical protein